MQVIVLGAGLAGVTTAWYLAQAGHQVTVVERQSEAGMETSFANGGQISVSHPEPWANPGAPAQIARWAFREDAPLKFRLRADRSQWSWGLRFMRECLPWRTRRNSDAIATLALDSRARLQALRRETGVEYDCLTRGILHLFFERPAMKTAAAKAALLAAHGIQAQVLGAAECIGVEPALADCAENILGGLYAPDDESGDAHKFTRGLARLAAERGVQFRYGTRMSGWDMVRRKVLGIQIVDAAGITGTLRADATVICLGSYSPLLARRAGERLPIYPVKGYSVTLPIDPQGRAPQVSITDESHRIVCSRLGDRLRVAGTAELNGYNLELDRGRCEPILRRALRLFPHAGDARHAEFWTGLRPATPSNVPVIGRSRHPAIFYNTGHGTLGWTLACGSGHAIAEIVSGRRPDLDFPFHRL